MSLDINKLDNVSEKPDGKITARCPACAQEGGDQKGENLVIFPDSKFGCVKYEGDAAHRNKIHSLAGDGKRRQYAPVKLAVRPFQVSEPTVLMSLGSFPRFSKDTKRQWPVLESAPMLLGEAASKAHLQMESPFTKDLPREVAVTGLSGQSASNDEKRGLEKSSFFNVPPRRSDTSIPVLPPNPMKDRV